MTSLTKAENKLEEFKAKVQTLPKKVQDSLENGIQALTELIDVFTYKKRKVEKSQLKDVYAWFDDEFEVLFVKVSETK